MTKSLLKKIFKIFKIWRENGTEYFFRVIFEKTMKPRIPNFSYLQKLFIGKSGLEIGGPSRIFKDGGFLPLYKDIKDLDGCNFSDKTIWEGKIKTGETYNYYNNKKGFQYILEATDIDIIPSSKYDFVISSHCLEHVANPLKALKGWIRVIKNDGLLFLVLPNKNCCFDHNRPITKLSHLLEDFKNDIKEDDLSHLDEILELNDLKMDKGLANFEQFRERSLNNFHNRALHQHVFDLSLLKEIFNYLNLEIILAYEASDRDNIILGKKRSNSN